MNIQTYTRTHTRTLRYVEIDHITKPIDGHVDSPS